MAIPGEPVSVRGLLSWTRGEFSEGSSTRVYESTTSSFSGASQVAILPSSTVSRGFTKTVPAGSSRTFFYWVRHVVATGTLGVLVGPVTGTYNATL